MIGVGMFIGVNALTSRAKKIRNTKLVYSGLAGIAVGLCLLALLSLTPGPGKPHHRLRRSRHHRPRYHHDATGNAA